MERLQQRGSIAVRRAVREDAPVLAELSSQLGYPTSEAESAERLRTLLRSADHAVFVACSPSGAVVGWVHVFLALRLESRPFAELGGFVVAEGHRRRGVGRKLLAAAQSWSQERGAGKLRVRSRVDRAAARAFYESRGFAATKRQQVFDKEIDDG